MNIQITTDLSEMVRMAKEIVNEKHNYYTTDVLNGIKTEIKRHVSEISEQDLENMMYKAIYYYWAYGATTDEVFYLHLGEMTHDEIKTYVTKREKVIIRNHLNRLEDAHILNNKWETYCMFSDYYGRDVLLLKDDNDFPAFCGFIEKHPEFVVKPTDMGQGQGVHKVTTARGIDDAEKKKVFDSLLSESKKNKELYHRGSEDSVLIEELLVQVPEMAAIHPNSVNGVRVTTIRVGDKVNIVHPWFKIGRGGQFLTSAVFGTLDACIDEETGVVITPGYTETDEAFDVHPDTGVSIVGFRIPQWEELKKTVTELARRLDTIHYVGWDMVLTDKGWVLMEGNFSGDYMWQMCLKRGTKREIEDMIGWRLTKEFWWQET